MNTSTLRRRILCPPCASQIPGGIFRLATQLRGAHTCEKCDRPFEVNFTPAPAQPATK